jgi:hypothetical protein
MTLYIPANYRIALYDHSKKRRLAYKQEAYEILGNRCQLCGSSQSLSHRFNDINNPLKERYRTNPATLFRRICLEPTLRGELHLLCRGCRLNSGVTFEFSKPEQV